MRASYIEFQGLQKLIPVKILYQHSPLFSLNAPQVIAKSIMVEKAMNVDNLVGIIPVSTVYSDVLLLEQGRIAHAMPSTSETS